MRTYYKFFGLKILLCGPGIFSTQDLESGMEKNRIRDKPQIRNIIFKFLECIGSARIANGPEYKLEITVPYRRRSKSRRSWTSSMIVTKLNICLKFKIFYCMGFTGRIRFSYTVANYCIELKNKNND